MNKPVPDPDGETARLIVALAQIISDASRCIEELRLNANQPWVTGGVEGIKNDASWIIQRCEAWLTERRPIRAEPLPIPTAEEWREAKRVTRVLSSMDAKKGVA